MRKAVFEKTAVYASPSGADYLKRKFPGYENIHTLMAKTNHLLAVFNGSETRPLQVFSEKYVLESLVH